MRLCMRGGLLGTSAAVRVRGSRYERLNASQARALLEVREPSLLALAEEPRAGRRGVRLRYDVSGLRGLRRYLRRARPSPRWGWQACEDLLGALTWCRRSHVPNTSLVCDPHFAFVGQEDRLRLLVVPLDGLEVSSAHTPLTLLAAIERACVRQVAQPRDQVFMRELHDYLLGASTTFSVNAYAAFVRLVREVVPWEEGPRPAYALVAESDGARYALASGRSQVIGRGETCDVRLADMPMVSRRHAVVRCDRRGATIADEGSANGTTVRGARLDAAIPVPIAYGERFELAGSPFYLENVEEVDGCRQRYS